jgi:hypothetical protein
MMPAWPATGYRTSEPLLAKIVGRAPDLAPRQVNAEVACPVSDRDSPLFPPRSDAPMFVNPFERTGLAGW